MDNPEAKRTHPRQKVAWAALWYAPDNVARKAVVCDVSEGGLFLRPFSPVPADINIGTSIRIAMVTDKGSKTLVGIVSWMGKHPGHQNAGLGIQFSDLSPNEEGG